MLQVISGPAVVDRLGGHVPSVVRQNLAWEGKELQLPGQLGHEVVVWQCLQLHVEGEVEDEGDLVPSKVRDEFRPHGQTLRSLPLAVLGVLLQSLALDEPLLCVRTGENVRRLSGRAFGDELHGWVAVAFPEKCDEEFEECAIGLGALAAEQPFYAVFYPADTLQEIKVGSKPLEDRYDPGALDGFVLERMVLPRVHKVEVPRNAVRAAVGGSVVLGTEVASGGTEAALDVLFDRGNAGLPVVGTQETQKPLKRVFEVGVVGAAEGSDLIRHGSNQLV